MKIALALVKVRILDVVEDRGDLVERPLYRPFGVDPLRRHEIGGATHENGIVEHQELRFENRGEIGPFSNG